MNSDLPTRLKKLAETAGNVTAFAKMCGMPQRTMANYISGVSEPRASDLLQIARAAHADPGWLLTGTAEDEGGQIVAPTQGDLSDMAASNSFPDDLVENVVTGIEIHLKSRGRDLEPAAKARLVVVMCRIMLRRRAATAVTGATFVFDAPGHPIDIDSDPDLQDIMRLLK